MAHRRMTAAKLTHIAAVDRPAQKGALALILKRDATIPANVEAYFKQTCKGLAPVFALPDASFPIANRADLRNAIHAFAYAKRQPITKAHIITRARALDATSMLPPEWKTSKLAFLDDVTNDQARAAFAPLLKTFGEELDGAGFTSSEADAVLGEYANALTQDIDGAVGALATVAAEIDADSAFADKAEALQEPASEFTGHIQGIVPEGIDNALVADALGKAGFAVTDGGAITKRGADMGTNLDNLKKSLKLSATATDADIEKAVGTALGGADFALNVLKMSPDHLVYMAKSEKMTDETKKQEFAALTTEKRDEFIKANPFAAADDDAAAAAAAADKKKKKNDDSDEVLKVDGREIRKSVVGEDTFAIFKSQQASIEKADDERATNIIEKRVATDLPLIGAAPDLAKMLRSISKSDAKLAEQVETVLKSAQAKIAQGGLFSEKGGSGNGAIGKASEEIVAKAQELISKGECKGSIYKAKDMVRRANPELAKRETDESKQSKAA